MRDSRLTKAQSFIRPLHGCDDCHYVSLAEARPLIGDVTRASKVLKLFLENLLRFHDGSPQNRELIAALARDGGKAVMQTAIPFRPARILSQDLAGVPLVVDLASLREAVAQRGGDPSRVNPVIPVDFVIDHSVAVDSSGEPSSLARNMAIELDRNAERFAFLRWTGQAFRNVRLIPPGQGICHQVNLERLASIVCVESLEDIPPLVFPDTVLCTDSHTTMVNGLGVLGWGAGGAEAELVMLGEPLSISPPEIVGVHLRGRMRDGVTPTDVVLTLTEALRRAGVVGKFLEYFGAGVETLGVPERATIANMAPDYGAACAYFGIDERTLDYLRLTGRQASLIARVEAYAKAQGLWATGGSEPQFSHVIDFDLSEVGRTIAGPERPDQRRTLSSAPASLDALLSDVAVADDKRAAQGERSQSTVLRHGDIVIAAITSCTNTSNPRAMVAAGLLARNALALGLKRPSRVKTSFAPGSRAVSLYLQEAGLQRSLDELGFNVVGYGCTTCIGNSGDLDPAVSAAIREDGTVAVAVLSGNRNFPGRVNPDVKASYLCSPPLVVAYALAGSILADLDKEPIGFGAEGRPVFLDEIWPSEADIEAVIDKHLRAEHFRAAYSEQDTEGWGRRSEGGKSLFDWSDTSTFIARPPYFDDARAEPEPIEDIIDAYALLHVGDSFTTDHISPAGQIAARSPAALFLRERGVRPNDLGTYGARRGSADVMVRGAFSNHRIRNELAANLAGGETTHFPSGQAGAVFDVAQLYRASGTPTVIIGGREYGTGSSRDWAAKGTRLLGVRAVIAESFERIHRANLVHAAVLPLQLRRPIKRAELNLRGGETFTVKGLAELAPRTELRVRVGRAGAAVASFDVEARIDTEQELELYRHGGLLAYAMRKCLSGVLGEAA